VLNALRHQRVGSALLVVPRLSLSISAQRLTASEGWISWRRRSRLRADNVLNALRHQRVGSVCRQEEARNRRGRSAQRLTASEGWIRPLSAQLLKSCICVLNALRHQRVGSGGQDSADDVQRDSAQRLTASEGWIRSFRLQDYPMTHVLNALRHQRVGSEESLRLSKIRSSQGAQRLTASEGWIRSGARLD